MKGYVKLHRKIKEWEWYQNSKTKAVFLDLLIRAQHKDGGFQGHPLSKGQCITSPEKLGNGIGLSASEVKTALKHLRKTGEITTKGFNRFTMVTLCNWEVYQCSQSEIDQQETHQSDKYTSISSPSNDDQLTTYKNDKNDKNVREGEEGGEHQPLWTLFSDTWSQSGMAKVFGNLMATPKNKEKIYRLTNSLKENGQSLEAYFEKCLAADWLLDLENAAKVLEGKYDEVIDLEKAKHGSGGLSEVDIAAKYGE